MHPRRLLNLEQTDDAMVNGGLTVCCTRSHQRQTESLALRCSENVIAIFFLFFFIFFFGGLLHCVILLLEENGNQSEFTSKYGLEVSCLEVSASSRFLSLSTPLHKASLGMPSMTLHAFFGCENTFLKSALAALAQGNKPWDIIRAK